MEIFLLLIWIHTIADFVLQSDKMALNKSSNNWALTSHVSVYTVFLLPLGLKFAIANFILHWITDYFSSRCTSYLWKRGERHYFFVVIGIDQALHLSGLLVTYQLFCG